MTNTQQTDGPINLKFGTNAKEVLLPMVAVLEGITARQYKLDQASKAWTATLEQTYKLMKQPVKFGDILSSLKQVQGELNTVNKDFARVGTVSTEAFLSMQKGIKPALGDLRNLDRQMLSFTASKEIFNQAGTSLETIGKRAQWVGRQLTTTVTLPIVAFGDIAIKQFMSVNREWTRLQQTLGQSSSNSPVIASMKAQAASLGKEFNVVPSMVAATFADQAAKGFRGADLAGAVKEVMRTAFLGNIDISTSQHLFQVLRAQWTEGAKTVGDQIKMVTNQVNQLDAVAQNTAIGLQGIVENLPQISEVAKKVGLSLAETTAIITGMAEQTGGSVADSASSMRFIFTKLNDITKGSNTKKGPVIDQIVGPGTAQAIASSGDGLARIATLLDKVNALPDPSQRLSAITAAVGGGRRVEQFLQLATEIPLKGETATQTLATLQKTADQINSKLLKTGASYKDTFAAATEGMTSFQKGMVASLMTSKSLSTAAQQEIDIKKLAPEQQWAALKVAYQQFMVGIGETLLPPVKRVFEEINKILQKFVNMPSWSKNIILGFGAILAAAGPMNMAFGQTANLLGAILKGMSLLIPSLKEVSAAEMLLRPTDAPPVLTMGKRFFEMPGSKKRQAKKTAEELGAGVQAEANALKEAESPAQTAATTATTQLSAAIDLQTASLAANTEAIDANIAAVEKRTIAQEASAAVTIPKNITPIENPINPFATGGAGAALDAGIPSPNESGQGMLSRHRQEMNAVRDNHELRVVEAKERAVKAEAEKEAARLRAQMPHIIDDKSPIHIPVKNATSLLGEGTGSMGSIPPTMNRRGLLNIKAMAERDIANGIERWNVAPMKKSWSKKIADIFKIEGMPSMGDTFKKTTSKSWKGFNTMGLGIPNLGKKAFTSTLEDGSEKMSITAPFKKIAEKIGGSDVAQGFKSAASKVTKPFFDGIKSGLEKGAGDSAIKGTFKKILGVLAGGAGGGMKSAILGITESFAGLVPAIAAVGAAFAPIAIGAVIIGGLILFVKALHDNWETVHKAMQPGIDALSKGFQAVKDAVGGVIKIFSDAIGNVLTPGGDGSKAGGFWEALGGIIGKFGEIAGAALNFVGKIIQWLAPLWKWLAGLIADAVGFVDALLQGDFIRALKALARGVIDWFVKPWAIGIDAIKNILLDFIKWIGDKILTPISKIHVLGYHPFGGIKDGFDSMINGLKDANLTDIVNGIEDKLFNIDAKPAAKKVVTGFVNAIYETTTPIKDAGKKSAQAFSDGLQAGLEKFKELLSALKSSIASEVSDLKESATTAYDQQADARKNAFVEKGDKQLQVYDDRINKIDEVKKALDREFAEEQYIQQRRDLLVKAALDQQNYAKERALAIYEGRINDARSLDLQEQKRAIDQRKSLQDLDSGHSKTLKDNSDEDAKKKLGIQKAALQKTIDAERKAYDQMAALQKTSFTQQLSELTKYTPKGPAEFKKMLDGINGLMRMFGASPVFPDTGKQTVTSLTQAMRDAFHSIDENKYWSAQGDALGYSWIQGIAKGINENVNIVTEAAAAAAAKGAAAAQGAGGVGKPVNKMNVAKTANQDYAYFTDHYTKSVGSWGPNANNVLKLLYTGGKVQNGMPTDPQGLMNVLRYLGVLDDKGNMNKEKLMSLIAGGSTVDKPGAHGGGHMFHHQGGWIKKFHDGGFPSLKSDEVPGILQTGEFVLSRDMVAQVGKQALAGLMNKTPLGGQTGDGPGSSVNPSDPLSDMQGNMQQGWKNIGDDADKGWDDITKILTDKFKKMHDIHGMSWDKIRKLSVDTLQKMKQDTVDAKQQHLSVWNDLTSATGTAWSKTYGTVGDWTDKITTKMTSAPSKWGGPLAILPHVFGSPVATTTKSVINFFVDQLNAFSKQVGLTNAFKKVAVPTFHTGGIAGESAKQTPIHDLKHDEHIAKLQHGEGIVPKNVMKKMGAANFKKMIYGYGKGDPVNSGMIAGGGDRRLPGYTLAQWAQAVFEGLGIKATPIDMTALETWANHESGGYNPKIAGGRYNPLNSTEHHFGEVGKGGAQGDIADYGSFAQGVANIVWNLSHGSSFGYDRILAAFRAGNNINAIYQAVNSSKFGTHGLGGQGSTGSIFGGAGVQAFDPGPALKKSFNDVIGMVIGSFKKGPITDMMFMTAGKEAAAASKYADNMQTLAGALYPQNISNPMPAGSFGPMGTGKGVDLLKQWRGREGSAENAIVPFMQQSGVPFQVTSEFRPGAISAGGGRSLHGFHRAVDFGGNLPSIYSVWRNVIGNLSELFYSGGDIFADKYGVHPISMMDPADRKNHYDHVHVGLAKGGLIKARPGGAVFRGGEGGKDEVIMPLPLKFDIEKHMKAFSSPAMIGQLVATASKAVAQANHVSSSSVKHDITENRSTVHIYVDNFIGQKSWFEKMMKEYDVEVAPRNRRAKGIIPSTVSSYSDNAKRFA